MVYFSRFSVSLWWGMSWNQVARNIDSIAESFFEGLLVMKIPPAQRNKLCPAFALFDESMSKDLKHLQQVFQCPTFGVLTSYSLPFVPWTSRQGGPEKPFTALCLLELAGRKWSRSTLSRPLSWGRRLWRWNKRHQVDPKLNGFKAALYKPSKSPSHQN